VPETYGAVIHDAFLDFLPIRGRVLDVGCGEGAWAGSLRARGAAALVGIEPNPRAATVAADRYDVVHLGAVESAALADLGGEAFDLVLFADVLEHLVDPWAVLRQARSWVADEGVLGISVPNLRHVRVVADLALRGRFSYEDSGVMDRTHLRWFTRESLTAALAETGWRPVRWGGKVSPRVRRVNASLGGRLEPFLAAQNYVLAARA
jgi:2-polyprenyl-3-methyl-5-hydroxy-6-metoxy-1,4-benzoquinol methylase